MLSVAIKKLHTQVRHWLANLKAKVRLSTTVVEATRSINSSRDCQQSKRIVVKVKDVLVEVVVMSNDA